MDSSLLVVLFGPARLFEDVCTYLSEAVGFEVDKVSRAACKYMMWCVVVARSCGGKAIYDSSCWLCWVPSTG